MGGVVLVGRISLPRACNCWELLVVWAPHCWELVLNGGVSQSRSFWGLGLLTILVSKGGRIPGVADEARV